MPFCSLNRYFYICSALCLSGFTFAQTEFPHLPREIHPGAGQIFYFVMPDRFANGNPDNDRGGIEGEREDHGFDPTHMGYYHGGDFAGLIQQLDYLEELGVTAIWFTPPFKNDPTAHGIAAYHGYHIIDFFAIDPHFGTEEEFREFIAAAHARDIRVFADIITNHTGDILYYEENAFEYVPLQAHTYRDAEGRSFDPAAHAYNGWNGKRDFPALDAKSSFPYTPILNEGDRHLKNPAWLNDPTLYHNRGNSLFAGESSHQGDFMGLDDLFTEHPVVVDGMIDIYAHWVREYNLDGFRIDTVKHVNTEFWQAFSPAIRKEAHEVGRPQFMHFGEVYSAGGDVQLLSEYNTLAPLDSVLDFGMAHHVRSFVSRGGSAENLAAFFRDDDWYTDHDSNVHANPTFIGNHDMGRFGHFLREDNGLLPESVMLDLMELAHGILYFARGQPVIYYGDEQGLMGTGHDMLARESLFPTRVPLFLENDILGTDATGADAKYDRQHPLYQAFSRLGAVRKAHSAIEYGAMIVRDTEHDNALAFSRIEQAEQVEYLAVFNNSQTDTIEVTIPTSQPAGAFFRQVYDSRGPAVSSTLLQTEAEGHLTVSLPPLQFMLWQSMEPLSANGEALQIEWVRPASGATFNYAIREVDGVRFPTREEILAEVTGGNGYAEVTFLLERASRPGQYDYLGTDDAPPYRIFWRPPADMAEGEAFNLIAVAKDGSGAQASDLLKAVSFLANGITLGIEGMRSPYWENAPETEIAARSGQTLRMSHPAQGSQPIYYQWYKDGAVLQGADQPDLCLPDFSQEHVGSYLLKAWNAAGAVVTHPIEVTAR